MSKFKCNHNWIIGSNYNSRLGASILECRKCGTYMTVNEASQMELWKHAVGFQKWLTIMAISISIASLIISFLK